MRGDRAANAGIALIIVLVITAILASLSFSLSIQTNKSTELVREYEAYTQLHYATLDAEAKALASLSLPRDSLTNNERTRPGQLEEHYIISQDRSNPIRVSMTVIDLQSKFNLSELSTQSNPIGQRKSSEVYHRFCRELGIVNHMCAALEQLVQSDSYASTTSPFNEARLHNWIHRLASRSLLDEHSLRMLLQHFTVLPPGTPINLQTTPEPLLVAMLGGASEAQIREFLAFRREMRLSVNLKQSVNPLLSRLSRSSLNVGNSSEFFEVFTTATAGKASRTLRTLVHRNGSSGRSTILSRQVPDVLIAPSIQDKTSENFLSFRNN
ncbi:general secretion pathway protein GspK [Parahaliea aestuarii]|uniref:Type II secretion system protein K n=1 Tax=Parahaliea aestuarii TaxID=1852021 RepID=A0A5C8ZK90_9GAMM|nr:general secretion pathway protein GspK [Parahaliea aestuarii]